MNDHNSHEEQALKVAQDEASTGCGQGRNVFRGRGRVRGGKQPIDRATIRCYYCHEFGNFQSECPKKPQDSRANYVEGGEVVLLMAQLSTDDKSNAQKIWFIDSGCNNHMIGRKDWFSSINSSFPDEVKLGNNCALKVAGKGTVKLLINEIMHLVNDVFYVPELKNNLSNMGQFLEKGLSIKMKQNKCEVFQGENLIFETFMTTNQMFAIFVKSGLFHNCFEVIIGVLFNYLIHSDICGPINPTSNVNKRYILTFIDDLSKKVWVYFLVEKGEALDVFTKFKALVEKQASVPIQILHIDRGGEYTSKEFVEFCNDILIERGVPRSLWLETVNWVVHILNRSPTLAVKNITPKEA
ncbi:hypothetical protein CR513_02345, partial [Mucuna pruriens]